MDIILYERNNPLKCNLDISSESSLAVIWTYESVAIKPIKKQKRIIIVEKEWKFYFVI